MEEVFVKMEKIELVDNKCKFKCRYCAFYCPQVFRSWKELKEHHEDNHASLASLPQPSVAVSESHYHKCGKCGSEVLQDNSLVENHIRLVHKMDPKTFNEDAS